MSKKIKKANGGLADESDLILPGENQEIDQNN